MKKRVALFLVLLVPAVVFAQTWAVVSLGSYHFERGDYRELNPGLGLEREISPTWSLIGGGYSNSHGRFSAYAGATYRPWTWQGARFGTLIGVVTGYDARPLPVVLPTMSIEGERYGLNVVVAPQHGDSPGMVGFQMKWRF